LKSFWTISPDTNDYEIFSDFVHLAGYSLYNALIKDQKIEKEYMTIVSKYSKEQAVKFSELLALVGLALIDKRSDFLGDIFMELGIKNRHTGQFFTPFSVSLLMAKIVTADMEEHIAKNGFFSVLDPACGSGSLVIAVYQNIIDKGFNPEQCMYVNCVDIDPVAAMTCYIQLSLLNIGGKVVIGNSLTLDYKREFITPAVIYNDWSSKFKARKFLDTFRELIKSDEKETCEEVIIEYKPLSKDDQLKLL